MKIEILYVSDCPFHPPAVALLKDALAAARTEAEIIEVLILDEQMAKDLRFRGSPTIRINGLDISGEPMGTGTFACRLYSGSPQVGVPPIEMVRRALAEAGKGGTP